MSTYTIRATALAVVAVIATGPAVAGPIDVDFTPVAVEDPFGGSFNVGFSKPVYHNDVTVLTERDEEDLPIDAAGNSIGTAWGPILRQLDDRTTRIDVNGHGRTLNDSYQGLDAEAFGTFTPSSVLANRDHDRYDGPEYGAYTESYFAFDANETPFGGRNSPGTRSGDGGHGTEVSQYASLDFFGGETEAYAELTGNFEAPVLKARSKTSSRPGSDGQRVVNTAAKAVGAQAYRYDGDVSTTLAFDVALDGELYTPGGRSEHSFVSAYVGVFSAERFRFGAFSDRVRRHSQAVAATGTPEPGLPNFTFDPPPREEWPEFAVKYLFTMSDGTPVYQNDDFLPIIVAPRQNPDFDWYIQDIPLEFDRERYPEYLAWRDANRAHNRGSEALAVETPAEVELFVDTNGAFDELRTIIVDVDPGDEFFLFGELIASSISTGGEDGFADAFHTLTTDIRDVNGGDLSGLASFTSALPPLATVADTATAVPTPPALALLLPVFAAAASARTLRRR